MVCIIYHPKRFPDLSKRLGPINSLLCNRIMFLFMAAMEILLRDIPAELTTPPILVFPNQEADADGSFPFHAYSDVCIDGFGVGPDQKQSEHTLCLTQSKFTALSPPHHRC